MKQKAMGIKKLLQAKLNSYLRWKHNRKTTMAVSVLVFVGILLNFTVIHSWAATSTMVPVSDVTAGWADTGGTDTSCTGGTHCDFVDDGVTDNTTTYIGTGTSGAGGEIEEYALDNNTTGIASATQIQLRVYAQSATNANGSTLDNIQIAIRINGTLQSATTCTPAFNTWAACTATYNGTWSQSDIDSLQARITRVTQGSGSPSAQDDDVRIANVYTTLTYTLNQNFEQSAYRWYNNQDASAPITFARAYGGSNDDDGNAVAQTSDGGYIVVGSNDLLGFGNDDVIITKYNGAGGIEWSKSWSGAGNDYGLDVIQSSDGGYVIAAETNSYGAGSKDVALIKYTSTGSLSWTRAWGTTSNESPKSVIETSDGGYAIFGKTGGFGVALGDVFIAKYTSTGTLSWSRTWGGASVDDPGSMVNSPDGGYVISGTTSSYGAGSSDAFITKFDSTGTLSWSRTWGGTGVEQGHDITVTSGGDFAISGWTDSYGAGLRDPFIAKFDSTGTLSWSRTWGGTGYDHGYSIDTTDDGAFVITGDTSSFGGAGSSEVFIAKFDSTGTHSWSRTWGTATIDNARSIIQTNDGGYAVVGDYDEHFLLKLNDQGNMVGCSSPTCQTVSPTTSSPTPGTSSPTDASVAQTATTSSPGATSADPLGLTLTSLVATNPTDIDVGSSLAALNTSATAPDEGTIFRLRLGLHVTGAQLDPATASFKLQYAPKNGTCSASTYADITDTTVIRYANNTNGGSGLGLATNANDPTHSSDTLVRQSYLEVGTAAFTSQTAVSAGQDGVWDFALKAYHSIGGDTYCFRVVKSDNSTLNTYTVYPEITMPATSFSQEHHRWYDGVDNNKTSFAIAYGGALDDYQLAGEPTSDGGYVSIGYTSNCCSGGSDVTITKYDSFGVRSWTKTWGGSGTEIGRDVKQTSDGGYIVAAATSTAGYTAGSFDFALIKYDSSGNLTWTKTWGGANGDGSSGGEIHQTSDGGYIYAGSTSSFGQGSSDVMLVKYDSSGTVSWSRTWGGAQSEFAYGLAVTTDGGYVVTGDTDSSSAAAGDGFVLKYTSTGTFSWSKYWNTDGSATVDSGDGVTAISGNAVLLWGHTLDGDYLAKIDSTGAITWDKELTHGSDSDDIKSISLTSDGGYIIAGQTGNAGDTAFNDVYLTKVNSSDAIEWTKVWGMDGSLTYEKTFSVAQTSDGGYIVLGTTESFGQGNEDALLLKFTPNGEMSGCDPTICKELTGSLLDVSITLNNATGTSATPSPTTGAPTVTTSTYSPTTSVIVTFAQSIGVPLTEQNGVLDFVSQRKPVTLKVAVAANNSGVIQGGQSFKLQFASKGSNATCSAVSSGSYSDVTTGTSLRYYDDSRFTSGVGIGSDVNDPTHSGRTMKPQTYQEANNFSNSSSAVYADEDGLWQFMLTVDSSSYKGAVYCIRVATSGGTQLSASNIAELKVNPDMNRLLRGGGSFSPQGTKNFKVLD